jgi:hypothetical protein
MPIDRHNAFGLPARMIGVVLDERNRVEKLAEGVGAIAGLREGDRIVEVDGVAVVDRTMLIAAIQQGDPRKLIVVERDAKRIELSLDWTTDPDEPARQQRRDERRQRFGPELRPWDRAREEPARHE